jgi:hypothetical protein
MKITAGCTDKLYQLANQTMKSYKILFDQTFRVSGRLNSNWKKLSLLGIALISFPSSTFLSLSTPLPVTASSVCPGSRIDSASIGTKGRVDLYYSNGRNCAVTISTDSDYGKPKYMKVYVRRATNDLGGNVDDGYFKYYAGPVSVAAPNTCIYWGGQIESQRVDRGPNHCR